MQSDLIQLESVSKSFGGVQALDSVSFGLRKGEIHAVVGENGAGKSTLMKMLAGVHSPDVGTIRLRGSSVRLSSPQAARRAGIGIVYQELSLFPDMSVAANLYLGREIRNRAGLVDMRAMVRGCGEALEALGVSLDPKRSVGTLAIGERQLVEIARTLVGKSDVVIMDEPNSALTEKESEQLYAILRRLREQGITVIYVSHRLEDVFALCDRITVLRDGRYQGTWDTALTSIESVISVMVGNSQDHLARPTADRLADNKRLLSVRGLQARGGFGPVSFEVGAGDVVGFAGVEGAGVDLLFGLLFGLDKPTGGYVEYEGRALPIRSPLNAIRSGIGLVPASRRDEGLIMDWPIHRNSSLLILNRLTNRAGLVDNRASRNAAAEWVRKLQIATDGVEKRVAGLSGGNQQKVLLAKWLAIHPRILILNDPTRGVDVGAKAEIHRLCAELAAQGVAILFRSSEIEETIAVCDRTFVFRRGRIAGEFARGAASKAHILHVMAGGMEEVDAA